VKSIIVTQNIEYHKSYSTYQDVLDHRLTEFIFRIGFRPLPMPNVLASIIKKNADETCNIDHFLASAAPSGFILSGGADWGTYPQRDITEFQILRYAEKHKLPVFGFCRGMQVMARFAGVETHPVINHVNVRHEISGKLNGTVNSYHNHAIKNCPVNFEILATSNDGKIEAIQSRILPWEAWMWHPEREKPFCNDDLSYLHNFFNLNGQKTKI
jgi:gamma-glutamyl-gamma-aminobutyrate hydrolase PuuD